MLRLVMDLMFFLEGCLGVFIIGSFLGYSLYHVDHLERDIL